MFFQLVIYYTVTKETNCNKLHYIKCKWLSHLSKRYITAGGMNTMITKSSLKNIFKLTTYICDQVWVIFQKFLASFYTFHAHIHTNIHKSKKINIKKETSPMTFQAKICSHHVFLLFSRNKFQRLFQDSD